MSVAIGVHHGPFGRAALYELDRPVGRHAHREGHLIIHIEGGRAITDVSGTKFLTDEVTAAAVSPWEPHEFTLLEDPSPCLCLVVYIKPMWFLENCQSVESVLEFGHPSIAITDEIRQHIIRATTVLIELQADDSMDGYFADLTRVCYDQSWVGIKGRSPLGRRKSRFSDFRVRRSMFLMQDRFDDELLMEDVARNSGLSRSHFFKLFKRQMGITPNLYLNTLRSERAISELVKTEKTVTDIGHDLGFSSQASFTRFFASNVGIPPSDYRRVARLT